MKSNRDFSFGDDVVYTSSSDPKPVHGTVLFVHPRPNLESIYTVLIEGQRPVVCPDHFLKSAGLATQEA